MGEYVIGIDVGGTRLKSGALSRSGALDLENTCPTGYALSPQAILEAVRAEVDRITRSCGSSPTQIALGFPGAVDPRRGVVLLPGKLQLEGFPIVPLLEEATGIPVIADNDGRLAILAEARYGMAQGYDWAVAVTLGTGVGTGVLLDGKILRDPHLQFGTQGSHVVQQSGSDRLCITRARGTANILCSATALTVLVLDGLARGLPSVLNDVYFEDPGSIHFKTVIDAAAAGDALCLDALATWRKERGWFLVSVVHMYAPQVIVLGGGAATESRHFLAEVRDHVNRHTFRYPVGEPIPIEISGDTEYCGVCGAGALAWEEADRRVARS